MNWKQIVKAFGGLDQIVRRFGQNLWVVYFSRLSPKMPAKVVLKFFMVSSPSAGWPTAFCNNEASRSITIWGLWNTHELKLKNWTTRGIDFFGFHSFYKIFANGTSELVFNGCLTSVTTSLATVVNSSALHRVRRVVRGCGRVRARAPSRRCWAEDCQNT